jgi:hypothetical protein
MTEDIYPHATHIVDIYHAREHLHDLAAHLASITPDPAQWLASRLDELDSGDIEAPSSPCAAIVPASPGASPSTG